MISRQALGCQIERRGEAGMVHPHRFLRLAQVHGRSLMFIPAAQPDSGRRSIYGRYSRAFPSSHPENREVYFASVQSVTPAQVGMPLERADSPKREEESVLHQQEGI